jgi:hypothetical protein
MVLQRIVALSFLFVVFARTTTAQERPRAEQPSGPKPSLLLEKRGLHRPPSLAASSNAEAQGLVKSFIDWASASTVREEDDVRRAIASAHENEFIAHALCEEVFRSTSIDHSRTIVALAVLGELRNPAGQECLSKFLHLPFPEKGTTIDGEIVEQTAMGMLQAQAVDGLAYVHSARADEEVLWAASGHPSRIVRAEAINAYLWNHGDSAEARTTLAKHVRPDETIFLDRIRREQGENAESFNHKLETFLKTHPQNIAPVPARSEKKKAKQPAKDKSRTNSLKPPVP